MFGLFDAPQTRRHKRAAQSAKRLREQAVRDMLIELRMLISQQARARQAQVRLATKHESEAALRVMSAVDASQETIDRVGRFNDMFPRELADLQRRAINAAGYEALASFELEARDFLIKVRDEAKGQLTPLAMVVQDAHKVLGDGPA